MFINYRSNKKLQEKQGLKIPIIYNSNGYEKVETLKTFPGYVLVEMVMTDQSWYVVRNTPGVTGFVGSHGAGSKPAPLLDEEIDHILNQLQGSQHQADFDAEVGDAVTIIMVRLQAWSVRSLRSMLKSQKSKL